MSLPRPTGVGSYVSTLFDVKQWDEGNKPWKEGKNLNIGTRLYCACVIPENNETVAEPTGENKRKLAN